MEDFEQEESLRSRSRSPVRRSLSRSTSPVRNKNGRQRQSGGGRRVIVRNIPYEVKWQDLKDMFRKGGGDVTYVEMLETPEGKSKGVAVVEFRDPHDAVKAVEEFHQKKIKDRAIIVREEREKDRQEFAQNKIMKERGRFGPGVDSLMGGGGGGMGLMGGGGGMGLMGSGGSMGLMGGGGMGLMGGGGGVGVPAGINPQILQQLGIEGPITSTVFVANLDYTVTWWKLKDVFRLAGNVITAAVKEDKDGRSRGMGVVVFEHPMEAVQAVSMFNGQKLFDRNMIVRVDKGVEEEKQPKLPSGLKSIGMGLGSGGAPLTNIGQMGNNVGLGGGSGLLGMGNLGGGGGNSGLGLLGAGSDAFGMGGFGGGGFSGQGFGNSGSLSSGGHGGLGLGGSVSDLGYGGMGGSSKMGGMSDSYSNNYPGLEGSNYNGMSGLGNLGPNLNSMSSGLGGNGDRFGGVGDALGLGRDRGGYDRMGNFGDRMGGLGDRLGGLSDRMGGLGDRMGGLGDRMGGLGDRMGGGLSDRMGGGLSDRMVDRMMGLGDMMGGGLDRMSEKLRDNYGSNDGRDMRDDGNRRMTRPGNSTLVVKNLPYSVTWQALKEHFRDAGDVKFAEIVVEKGKSTGVGYVRFGNESDAQRAIGMKNKSRMEHRNIDVSLHRN